MIHHFYITALATFMMVPDQRSDQPAIKAELDVQPQTMPVLPFAGGPRSQAVQVKAVIQRCRVKVQLHNADQGRVLVFLVGDGGGARRIDCLSRWIRSQPEEGFQRYGFISRG